MKEQKKVCRLFHGIYRSNSHGRAYLFLFEKGKRKRRILSLQPKLPLANGQCLSIEGLEKGRYLYVKQVYKHDFPKRKKIRSN